MSRRAKFGDLPPPGCQTWDFHTHRGERGHPSVGNFGPPYLSRWNSCKCGRFEVLDPARRRASVQVCEVRGSPRMPNVGFPCPSGRAWEMLGSRVYSDESCPSRGIRDPLVRSGKSVQGLGFRRLHEPKFLGSPIRPDGHRPSVVNLGFCGPLGQNLHKPREIRGSLVQREGDHLT